MNTLSRYNSISADKEFYARLNEGPWFEHDCDACTFLGRYVDPADSQNYDLYYCGEKPDFMTGEREGNFTLIGRFGSEGHEYSSGSAFVGSSKHLTEAFFRAMKLHYVFWHDLEERQLHNLCEQPLEDVLNPPEEFDSPEQGDHCALCGQEWTGTL